VIRAVFEYHKKLFKCNPIVITVMVLYGLIYVVNRSRTVYLVNHDFFDFVVESVIFCFAAFHFMPAFFNRENYAKRDAQFLDRIRVQDTGNERTRSISRNHSASLSSRYDHNRNSPSSSLITKQPCALCGHSSVVVIM
jgi:hypothetical protein